MAITLKLDAKALERVFCDDDGVIRLDIAQTIVEEFSKRHIKALASTDTIKEAINNVSRAVEAEANSILKNEVGYFAGNWGRDFKINPSFENQIKVVVERATRDIVNGMTDTLLKQATEGVERYYKDLTEKYIPKMIQKKIDDDFENRVEAEIHRRIKLLAGKV